MCVDILLIGITHVSCGSVAGVYHEFWCCHAAQQLHKTFNSTFPACVLFPCITQDAFVGLPASPSVQLFISLFNSLNLGSNFETVPKQTELNPTSCRHTEYHNDLDYI